MYNIFAYNTQPYNATFTGLTPISQGDFVFNGYELNSNIMTIQSSNFDNSHLLERTTYNNPLSNGITEVSSFARGKTITFDGYISTKKEEYTYWKTYLDDIGETYIDNAGMAYQDENIKKYRDENIVFNKEIDILKKFLLQPQKNLDIKVNGTIRRAKASLVNGQDIFYRNNWNINYMDIKMQFECLEYFKEIVEQAKTYTGKTANFNEIIYNEGTANTQPQYIFVFNSASSVTSTTVKIGGLGITVNQGISSSDILIIDCQNKNVTYNGTNIDYLGRFENIELVTGANDVYVTVNGTKNFNFSIKYFNTFL